MAQELSYKFIITRLKYFMLGTWKLEYLPYNIYVYFTVYVCYNIVFFKKINKYLPNINQTTLLHTIILSLL